MSQEPFLAFTDSVNGAQCNLSCHPLARAPACPLLASSHPSQEPAVSTALCWCVGDQDAWAPTVYPSRSQIFLTSALRHRCTPLRIDVVYARGLVIEVSPALDARLVDIDKP